MRRKRNRVLLPRNRIVRKDKTEGACGFSACPIRSERRNRYQHPPQPQPLPPQPHPNPLLPQPPQQQRRRMIHRQLSLPQPLPQPPHPLLPQPPQQQRRRIIHRQELFNPHPFPFPQPPHPQLFAHPLSQPHPQFVAVNSLIFKSSERFFDLQCYSMRRKRKCEMRNYL